MKSIELLGLIMGKVLSRLTRPIRTMNIENRAQKVISREKPVPAPHHASVSKQKELVDKMYPNFMEEHNVKNPALDERLKNVFVTSDDPVQPEQKTKEETAKVLPQKGVSAPDFEFGFYEADTIPEGRCSLRQALAFMKSHADNPTEHTIEKIAVQYKLDKNVVASILKHFKIPEVETKTNVTDITITLRSL
ncbi:NADH dehydrogenase [ubiquinone] 1 alpha subcomplex assembly factor 4 isoform X2 [Halictus rubicundus]|uniref:NADH dehydrogenase [ubiquinone] 1 alpha subcomplex assembly factor 4 isoform X2 n=1 Tax=Halictus rubicundus TaxID=77578 RepID=UPI004036272F